jgi:hypothetical protein
VQNVTVRRPELEGIDETRAAKFTAALYVHAIEPNLPGTIAGRIADEEGGG